MNCQNLFSGKNKKNNITNLSSAELAQRAVKVKKYKCVVSCKRGLSKKCEHQIYIALD